MSMDDRSIERQPRNLRPRFLEPYDAYLWHLLHLVDHLDTIPLEVDPKNSKTTSAQPRWTVWIAKETRDKFLERKAVLAPTKTHGHFIELLLSYKESLNNSTMFPPTPPKTLSVAHSPVLDDNSFRNRSNSIAINRPTPISEKYSRSFDLPSRTASHPPPPRLRTNSPVSRPNSSPYSGGTNYPGQGYFFADTIPQSPYRVTSHSNNAYSPLVNSYSFNEIEMNDSIISPEANHPSPFQPYVTAIPIQQRNKFDIAMQSPPFMIDVNATYGHSGSLNSQGFEYNSPTTFREIDMPQASMQQFSRHFVEPDLQTETKMYPSALSSDQNLWQNDFPESDYF